MTEKQLALIFTLVFSIGLLVGFLVGIGVENTKIIRMADTGKAIYQVNDSKYFVIKDNALPVSKETK